MSNSSSPIKYLDQFVFCGLCFKKMILEKDEFKCPSGCTSGISGIILENLMWKEMGRLLSSPSFRHEAEKKLREKLSEQQIRRLFRELDEFTEFLPVKEKLKFASALLEKIDVYSENSIKMSFRV